MNPELAMDVCPLVDERPTCWNLFVGLRLLFFKMWNVLLFFFFYGVSVSLLHGKIVHLLALRGGVLDPENPRLGGNGARRFW